MYIKIDHWQKLMIYSCRESGSVVFNKKGEYDVLEVLRKSCLAALTGDAWSVDSMYWCSVEAHESKQECP